jgi:hypothetical protein
MLWSRRTGPLSSCKSNNSGLSLGILGLDFMDAGCCCAWVTREAGTQGLLCSVYRPVRRSEAHTRAPPVLVTSRGTAHQPMRPTVTPLALSAGPSRGDPSRALPPVRHTARGVADTSPLDDADRAALLSGLEADVFAPSTTLARASAVRTWSRYHSRWFGEGSPVLPVTTYKLRAVAAQFKALGYRSFPNYLTAIELSDRDKVGAP